ncbi:MAG: ABC transporter permease [Fimbriimonas sp.]|nr:ABC transporter permease [Fimbriimonas sp.]
MRLVKAILLRLLFGAFSLFFISFVTFVAGAFAPGDPATIIGGEKASQETIRVIRHNLGLDQPWPQRYVLYVEHAAHGDFGVSYYGTHEPVKDILARTVPMTVKLATQAMVLASAFGIVFGTLAAVYQRKFADKSILTLSTLGVTTPNFVLGPILVYIFCQRLDRLPLTWSTTLVAPEIVYFILPVTILAARPAALITRLTRASMIDTLDQEFIRTAVAKGVPRGRLLFRHALRNAILPVITTIGTSFGFLLTGSFVIERYFLMPGLGSAVIEGIQQTNMPVVQAGVFVTGAMFIFLNLVVDILLPVLDPRIRESQI